MPEHTPAPTPSRAVYGFAMYLTFRIFFIIYAIWAVVPEDWFKLIGITCLPQRYWAVTIPIFLFAVLIVFAFFIYPNMGLFMTPAVDDTRTIQDSSCKKKGKSRELQVQGGKSDCCVNKNKCFKDEYERNCGDFVAKAVPTLQDLKMWDVSDHLYLK